MGLNLSDLSQVRRKTGSTVTLNGDMIAGVLLGGYVNYSFTSVLAAQSEVLFSMQGAAFFLDPHNVVIRLNYINVPVLLEVKPIRAVPFSVLAGPQVGWCVAKRSEGKKMDVSQASVYNDFDFSIALGAQYTFMEHLVCGVRYNLGVRPVFDVEFDSTTSQKGGRNNVLQLSVGWTF